MDSSLVDADFANLEAKVMAHHSAIRQKGLSLSGRKTLADFHNQAEDRVYRVSTSANLEANMSDSIRSKEITPVYALWLGIMHRWDGTHWYCPDGKINSQIDGTYSKNHGECFNPKHGSHSLKAEQNPKDSHDRNERNQTTSIKAVTNWLGDYRQPSGSTYRIG